jgi:hypothetical protein
MEAIRATTSCPPSDRGVVFGPKSSVTTGLHTRNQIARNPIAPDDYLSDPGVRIHRHCFRVVTGKDLSVVYGAAD